MSGRLSVTQRPAPLQDAVHREKVPLSFTRPDRRGHAGAGGFLQQGTKLYVVGPGGLLATERPVHAERRSDLVVVGVSLVFREGRDTPDHLVFPGLRRARFLTYGGVPALWRWRPAPCRQHGHRYCRNHSSHADDGSPTPPTQHARDATFGVYRPPVTAADTNPTSPYTTP